MSNIRRTPINQRITAPPARPIEQPTGPRKEWTNYDQYLNDQRKIFDNLQKVPAKFCVLCGYPLDYNNHVPTEPEQKWSVHEPCQKKAWAMLDRETGVTRERKNTNGKPTHRGGSERQPE